jgi:hypothetical protein
MRCGWIARARHSPETHSAFRLEDSEGGEQSQGAPRSIPLKPPPTNIPARVWLVAASAAGVLAVPWSGNFDAICSAISMPWQRQSGAVASDQRVFQHFADGVPRGSWLS